ncbi:hypothetical protein AWC38_SpisGene23607 [Stylophora pistillata]|uniref:Uncharacterized protein n=1 Tax=Stylophora pistillata TaxID=50429 RepID=A0A2B4R7V4_STYPI|nr:hypothetical protein AWC38_SpisGene23607 [Stylophora pistillata]
MMAIPKELFDMACEELMPLRERVCILILKITVLVSSALIVFSLIMMSSFDTTPLMKNFLMFLTLSFPKIVAMYFGGGWQKKLRAMVIEEKVPKIVEKFIRESSKTTRGHEKRDINVKNDEVILVNLPPPEHLPYVACRVWFLFFYYIWTSYSSFTKAYHELSLALFHCNKLSRSDDQLLKLPITPHEIDIMAIPKELFDMACEELMPLRERVCILILKITVLVSFVLIVFSLTMKSSSDTTPLIKTLLTFLTLSFPKIVAMYVGGGWQKKLRATVIKEKVPKIVEKFIRESSKTTRGHEQKDINVKNDEVILVNEDYMELTTI